MQLIGKMLVEAGMEEGKEVSFLPSYGAEMRGGTSNCNVIISDEPVCSPIVNEATCVMALNRRRWTSSRARSFPARRC